jgi:hypothetical protein
MLRAAFFLAASAGVYSAAASAPSCLGCCSVNEAPNVVVPTKFYDGSFKYALEPELKEPEIPPDAVLAAIDSFSNAAMRLAAPAPEQEDTYATIRKDLLEWTATAKTRIEVYQNISPGRRG